MSGGSGCVCSKVSRSLMTLAIGNQASLTVFTWYVYFLSLVPEGFSYRLSSKTQPPPPPSPNTFPYCLKMSPCLGFQVNRSSVVALAVAVIGCSIAAFLSPSSRLTSQNQGPGGVIASLFGGELRPMLLRLPSDKHTACSSHVDT